MNEFDTYKQKLEEDNLKNLERWRLSECIVVREKKETDEDDVNGNEWKPESKTGRYRLVCRKPYCPQFVWKMGICAKHYRWSQPCSFHGCPNAMGGDGRKVSGFPLCKEHVNLSKVNPAILHDL